MLTGRLPMRAASPQWQHRVSRGFLHTAPVAPPPPLLRHPAPAPPNDARPSARLAVPACACSRVVLQATGATAACSDTTGVQLSVKQAATTSPLPSVSLNIASARVGVDTVTLPDAAFYAGWRSTCSLGGASASATWTATSTSPTNPTLLVALPSAFGGQPPASCACRPRSCRAPS